MEAVWRAVDHEGEVLESYVTKTRDKAAALRFMRKVLKRHGSPQAITTEGLRSYGAATDELGHRAKQDVGRWGQPPCGELAPPVPTTRAGAGKLSHEDATEVRLGARCLSNRFALERHLVDRTTYQDRRSAALAEWGLLAS